MLPMAYVDPRTTKFYFCEFFLTVPIFVCRETSEKIPTEQLFLCKTVVLWETYLAWRRWLACCFALLVQASYHWAADVAKADDQTGLASGSSPTQACQEIALGVYATGVPTPPQVALRGPWGSFPTIDDWRVAMMLTWPWWPLEGSLLAGACRIGHSPKKKFLFLLWLLSRGGFLWSLNSKCPRPTALSMLSGLAHLRKKTRSDMDFW